MKNGTLAQVLFVLISAAVSSSTVANPIAPWHSPPTPQDYSTKQAWGTGCAPNKNWLARISKRSPKYLEPITMKEDVVYFSTEEWHVKKLLGIRILGGSYDFLSAKVKNGTIEYYYTVQRGAAVYSYQRYPSWNIESLDARIGNEMVSYGNVKQYQSDPVRNDGGALVTYSIYASSEIPLDQKLVDFVAGQPDSSLVTATLWMSDGLALGCPIYLNPLEFRAMRNAANRLTG